MSRRPALVSGALFTLALILGPATLRAQDVVGSGPLACNLSCRMWLAGGDIFAAWESTRTGSPAERAKARPHALRAPGIRVPKHARPGFAGLAYHRVRISRPVEVPTPPPRLPTVALLRPATAPMAASGSQPLTTLPASRPAEAVGSIAPSNLADVLVSTQPPIAATAAAGQSADTATTPSRSLRDGDKNPPPAAERALDSAQGAAAKQPADPSDDATNAMINRQIETWLRGGKTVVGQRLAPRQIEAAQEPNDSYGRLKTITVLALVTALLGCLLLPSRPKYF